LGKNGLRKKYKNKYEGVSHRLYINAKILI